MASSTTSDKEIGQSHLRPPGLGAKRFCFFVAPPRRCRTSTRRHASNQKPFRAPTNGMLFMGQGTRIAKTGDVGAKFDCFTAASSSYTRLCYNSFWFFVPMRRVLLALEMIKVEHTVFALPFAFLGAFLAARGFPPWQKGFWIVFAMLGARSAAMAFNRLADRVYDGLHERTASRALPPPLADVALRSPVCAGQLGFVHLRRLEIESIGLLPFPSGLGHCLFLQLYETIYFAFPFGFGTLAGDSTRRGVDCCARGS